MDSLRSYMESILALSLKDAKIYFFKGPVITLGLLMPFFLWLAFVIGNRTTAGSISALISITVFFTASAVTPIVIPWETRQRSLEMLLAGPVTVEMIVLGESIASSLLGILISLVLVGIGFLFGMEANLLILVPSLVIASFCYSFLGLIFSSIPSDVPADAIMLASAVRLPLIFISGVFIPVSSLPTYLLGAAFLSPLTYFVDMANFSYYGVSLLPPALDAAMLIVFTLAFLYASISLNKRTMLRRL
ncbi:MAG: ABC transporter permease [Thermoprotei archaeon]|nr:MAG: ABC transporter permease [Thermoprotei archaeon]